MSEKKSNGTDEKKPYLFGGIKEYDLEQIETEVLNESMYLEVFAGSDQNFKKNVTPLSGSLDRLLKLKGVSFEWKTDEFKDKAFDNKKQLGFIAQDVQKQFPQLVRPDSDGYLTVNYSKITPVLLEGIREMSDTILNLENRISELEQKLSNLS